MDIDPTDLLPRADECLLPETATVHGILLDLGFRLHSTDDVTENSLYIGHDLQITLSPGTTASAAFQAILTAHRQHIAAENQRALNSFLSQTFHPRV